MEPSSTVCGVPFAQTPRPGQLDVINAVFDHKIINCQLPTGYGKTFTACGAFSALYHAGDVTHLLYVVPGNDQLRQFCDDGMSDLRKAGMDVNLITDVSYFYDMALVHRDTNKTNVFAINIESLITEGRKTSGLANVKALMSKGRWMLVVDEYHHYGVDKAWGKAIKKLPYQALLAMSATPDRPGEDSAFGKPDIRVTYEHAMKEGAVKPLRLHSYTYQLDAVKGNGEIESFTTDELFDAVGSDTPDDIEKFRIEQDMRWSPKYVSPLVDYPLARLDRARLESGYPLQAIVFAMCCSHAELVCKQIKSMFPHYRVDWCGTGMNGRTNEENKAVMTAFNPPKDKDGNRNRDKIELDILVNVAKAGEGFDSLYVSEVIHLHKANINNTSNQKNGRASRFIEGVTGYINVDSCSQYAEFTGAQVMTVMDDPGAAPSEEPEEQNDDYDDLGDLPEEPKIRLIDLKCIYIDKGEVERMAQAITQAGGFDESILSDPEHPIYERAEDIYRRMRSKEAEQLNEVSLTEQWSQSVERALSHVTRVVIGIMTGNKARAEKSLAGDIKTRINIRKSRDVGKKAKDVDILKRHYNWLVSFEHELKRTGNIPQWLR